MDFEILATGNIFVKRRNIRATGPVINRLLRESEGPIHMLVYKIGPSIGLWKLLENKLDNKHQVTIILSMKEQLPFVKKRLLNLASKYADHLYLMNFNNPHGGLLHAKVLVVDRKIAVLGSANFSKGGLANHYEVGMLIKDSTTSWEIANMIEDLADSDLTTRVGYDNPHV